MYQPLIAPLEISYIVRVQLTRPTSTLGGGDWRTSWYAFYCGNVEYALKFYHEPDTSLWTTQHSTVMQVILCERVQPAPSYVYLGLDGQCPIYDGEYWVKLISRTST